MSEAQLSLGVSKEDVFSNISSNGLDVKQCILNRREIIASILEEIEGYANRTTFLVSNVPAKTLVRISQELARLGKPFNRKTCPCAFKGSFRVNAIIPTDSDSPDSLKLCHGTAFLATSRSVAEYSFVLEYRIAKIAPGIMGWIHINYIPKISGVTS